MILILYFFFARNAKQYKCRYSEYNQHCKGKPLCNIAVIYKAVYYTYKGENIKTEKQADKTAFIPKQLCFGA